MICIGDLWAKTEPFQSVVTHGIVSGSIGQKLTEHFLSCGTRKQISEGLMLSVEELPSFIGYFVSLHDIGKIHYSFQSKDPVTKEKLCQNGLQGLGIAEPGFRHEKESCMAAKRIFKSMDRKTASRLAEILGAHHQGKNENIRQQTADPAWESLQQEYESEMRKCFLKGETSPVIQKDKDGAVCALLLGIVILSDWIASGDYFTEAEQWDNLIYTAQIKADEFLKKSGLYQEATQYGKTFCDIWPNIPEDGKRELQEKAELLFQDSAPRCSLVLMEAPMGEGKTEAGVYAALRMAEQWGKNGFYVALPTSATANQMVGRMRTLLSMHDQEESVKLLHAMAWMVDRQSAENQNFTTEEDVFARNWLMPMRRGLLSSYAVGTVDQAMMAAMFIKYGVLRLLGLSGKALIIDEIHAYDTYMQNILTRLLEWCKALEIPVVLLSATLPPEKKQQLLGIYSGEDVGNDYPAITAAYEDGTIQVIPFDRVAKRQSYSIQLQPILHKEDQIADFAIEQVKDGGCLCILLNTVKQAQETYAAIRRKNYSGKLLLFHSRFLAGRREEIETECLRLFGKDKQYRPQSAILVATQVVEQSLDVDFDFFMSAAAPIDLLIQRMGRQFRHEQTIRPVGVTAPVFTVLVPEDNQFQADGIVYPECLLKQTIALLRDKENIRVPDDIAQRVADGYDAAKVPPEELEKWMETLVDESMKGAMADKYKLSPPSKKFRALSDPVDFDDLEIQSYLSAKTRLSEPTIRIALLQSDFYERLASMAENGKLQIWDENLAQEILRNSVSIRQKVFRKLQEKYEIPSLTGEKLIIGVMVVSKQNPCFWDDADLGFLWKEDKI